MARIKGRYVAQIVFDFDLDEADITNPYDYIGFDKAKERICGGEFTQEIEELLLSEMVERDAMTLTVEQQYADLYLVEDES